MWETDRPSQSTPFFGAVRLDFVQQGALVTSAFEGDYWVY